MISLTNIGVLNLTIILPAGTFLIVRSDMISIKCDTNMPVPEDEADLLERLAFRLWADEPDERDEGREDAEVDQEKSTARGLFCQFPCLPAICFGRMKCLPPANISQGGRCSVKLNYKDKKVRPDGNRHAFTAHIVWEDLGRVNAAPAALVTALQSCSWNIGRGLTMW